MSHPLLHWDILELLVKRYSRENGLAETCKRLYRVRPTREKYINAFAISLESVKWIRPSKESRSLLIESIVKQDNLQLLQQMSEEGYLIDNNNVACIAARYGRLEIIRWAYDQTVTYAWEPYPSTISDIAASHGHVEILEFVRDKSGWSFDEHVSVSAAEKGHLHVLKWLHEHGCSIPKYLCQWRTKDCEVFEWLNTLP